MARTIRRHVFHRVHASVLAAALALPAGLTTAMAAQQTPPTGRPDAPAPAQTTPPTPPTSPSPPTPSGPTEETPTPSYTPTPDSTPPSAPAESTPDDATSPDGTTPTDQPSGEVTDGGGRTEPPPEQIRAVAEVTAALNARRDDVPEELKSSVDSLTDTLRVVAAPETKPQDRGAVTDSARALASTLGVISDDSTPGELRNRLTGLVKQVTAAMKAGQEPDVAEEDVSRLFLVAKRTTSALDTIADRKTPRKTREQLATIVENVNYGMEKTKGEGETGRAGAAVGASIGFLNRPNPSQDETGSNTAAASSPAEESRSGSDGRTDLGDRSQQVSQEMKRASDPDASPEERAEALREMRKHTARMKAEQRKAAAAQEEPDADLGGAAEVCANAIFISVSERKLSKGLEDLTPQSWDSTGVKDFWKARAEGNKVLDVRAFLRNNENTHAPFEVAKLIISLAVIVPLHELPSTVGDKPTAHCKQAASYLDEDGFTAGDWAAGDDY
ncbi:hypothetical protein [Streptomyces chartreusis]|uniref:hypothetical protein n=1 Tax=Streptomyces chartreusis TaxID=1969 RepID=UPI0036527DD9